MSKSSHFTGQPIYSQLLSLLDKRQIMRLSQELSGERYTKRFDAWAHLVVMLYAVIKRFDSLREIAVSLLAEAPKLQHFGISTMGYRSTLSDANKRRPEAIFASIYHYVYAQYRHELSSDSCKKAQWLKRLQIIDSTTITLFSNLIFKGVGRHPKRGKKKGGIKVHSIIHAYEQVPCDIQFTSAATHDSFMLQSERFTSGDILAFDRAYMDYEKFELLSQRGAIYVTKMKKNLRYRLLSDTMVQAPEGLMELRLQEVIFSKIQSDGTVLQHKARLITYPEDKRSKLTTLLTNDLETDPYDLIQVYHTRWEIGLLFKQLKQNFPLRYFYGESTNTIKIQIGVTLLANLLLMVLKARLKRAWSFSGLATIMRICLMFYADVYTLLEHPERDWVRSQKQRGDPRYECLLFE